jgi:hypothetical protein
MNTLARCTARSCPVRYRSGPDRACADHRGQAAAITATAEELGVDLAAIPEMPGGRWQNTTPAKPD